MKLEKNKSLKELTTWRVGGPADYFVNAKTDKDIKEAIGFAKINKIPFVVFGNGSNILINDSGFRGLVIKVSNKEIALKGTTLTCEAGLPLSEMLKFATNNKLHGAEFLWGIPGTIGGAIVGNAGMNNKSLSNILQSVKIIDSSGKFKTLKNADIKFSYRNSDFKKNNSTILKAKIKLLNAGYDVPTNLAQMRLKQPKGFSAGSVFKNPKQGIAAGKLIEDSGLKGKKIGGAIISKLHGNFILNNKNAKASDILKLISLIQEKVMNKFGVQLKREIRVLNETGWE